MNKNQLTKRAIVAMILVATVLALQGCSRPQQTPNTEETSGKPSSQPTMDGMRYNMQLINLLDGIRQLETKGQNKLSAVQAKSIMDIITSARASDTLSETDAKDAIRAVQLVLNETQRTEISAMTPDQGFQKGRKGRHGGMRPEGGPGGPPPGGGAPPAGGGPGGAQQGGSGMGPMNMLKSPPGVTTPVDDLMTLLEKKSTAK